MEEEIFDIVTLKKEGYQFSISRELLDKLFTLKLSKSIRLYFLFIDVLTDQNYEYVFDTSAELYRLRFNERSRVKNVRELAEFFRANYKVFCRSLKELERADLIKVTEYGIMINPKYIRLRDQCDLYVLEEFCAEDRAVSIAESDICKCITLPR